MWQLQEMRHSIPLAQAAVLRRRASQYRCHVERGEKGCFVGSGGGFKPTIEPQNGVRRSRRCDSAVFP
jgi:hypothetical protein